MHAAAAAAATAKAATAAAESGGMRAVWKLFAEQAAKCICSNSFILLELFVSLCLYVCLCL